MTDIHIKIRGGTRGGKRLCDTCSYATIMKGTADSQEVVLCSQINDRPTPFKVVECNTYYDKTAPSLKMLHETALIIENRKDGSIGFVNWKRFKERNSDDESVREYGY